MAILPPKRPIVLPPKPTLPASFLQKGFVMPDQARKRGGSKFRGLMIATEGLSDSGKTEFMLSAPGPGMILACDRGFDAVFDNPNPPVTRRGDFGVKPIPMPTVTDFQSPADYLPFYKNFYVSTIEAIRTPEARTVCIDGDNLSWDLQKLTEWGKLTTFPQVKFADPNAARMSFYHQLWESGKIIITSNMMRSTWRDVLDGDGKPVLDAKGERKREPTGDHEAMGFPNQAYLWQLRLRHLYRGPVVRKLFGKEVHIPQQWGIRIVKCKPNPMLVGEELWGESCNFLGLVQLVYPNVDPAEWGF